MCNFSIGSPIGRVTTSHNESQRIINLTETNTKGHGKVHKLNERGNQHTPPLWLAAQSQWVTASHKGHNTPAPAMPRREDESSQGPPVWLSTHSQWVTASHKGHKTPAPAMRSREEEGSQGPIVLLPSHSYWATANDKGYKTPAPAMPPLVGRGLPKDGGIAKNPAPAMALRQREGFQGAVCVVFYALPADHIESQGARSSSRAMALWEDKGIMKLGRKRG